MRLSSEFIRLPLAFDVAKLLEEAHQFSEYEWDYHPQNYDGNTALSLVSSGGGRSDSYTGSMQATPALSRAPYVQQIMSAFGAVIGRSRFMRLAPGKNVPPHSDTDYTWRNRVRIHIPIITDPAIMFCSLETSSSQGVKVHMRAGEAWIFDNWREHAVYNDSDVRRIHLVIDTVGSAEFWELASHGWDPTTPQANWADKIRHLAFDESAAAKLNFEQFNVMPVRSPDEIDNMMSDLLDELEDLRQQDKQGYGEVEHALKRFCQDWRALWAMYWDTPQGIAHYDSKAQLLKTFLNDKLGSTTLKSNGARAYDVAVNWLDLTTDDSAIRNSEENQAATAEPAAAYAGQIPTFDRPIFIVSAPRAGSTIVFEILKNNKELWTLGDAMHNEIESNEALDPSCNDYGSNVLTAEDFDDDVGAKIMQALMLRLQNTRWVAYTEMQSEFQPSRIRFLEQSPKNALRIPFLKAMFPDAKFVFLHRDARSNIGSIIDAWESQHFVTYPELSLSNGLNWSLPLIEGWLSMKDRPLAEVAAFQWAQTNGRIMSDLGALGNEESMLLSYDDLVNDSLNSLERLCNFSEIPFGPRMQTLARQGYPNSKYVLSDPHADKWKRHESEIEEAVKIFEAIEHQVAKLSQGD